MKTKNTTSTVKTVTSTAKQFTTINEWMQTSPKEEEIKKVLELINKSSKREMKQLLWNKKKELNKLTKFVDQLKEWGFKLPDDKVLNDMTEKTQIVINEIHELQTEIGPIIKRTKKEEVKEEPKAETEE